jgi:ankyrin repeat protein
MKRTQNSSQSEASDWDDFLREAVAEDEVELIRHALAQGANPNVIMDDLFGGTTLFWAVYGGHIEAVKILLKAGATVASESEADQTSLHAAVENNDLPMLELLLDADGAVALNWFDYVDRTPLMVAAEENNLDFARRLVAAGADVNANNEERIGDTALHQVAANGSLEMARLLINAGADPTLPGWMWITPLYQASQRKKPEGRQIYELLERVAKERRDE